MVTVTLSLKHLLNQVMKCTNDGVDFTVHLTLEQLCDLCENIGVVQHCNLCSILDGGQV